MLTSTAVRPAVYATHSAVPSTRVVHARRENGQERSPAHGLRQPHRLGAQRHHQQRHGAEEGAAGKGNFLPLGDRLGGGGCRMCSSTTPDIGSRDPLIARIFCICLFVDCPPCAARLFVCRLCAYLTHPAARCLWLPFGLIASVFRFLFEGDRTPHRAGDDRQPGHHPQGSHGEGAGEVSCTEACRIEDVGQIVLHVRVL